MPRKTHKSRKAHSRRRPHTNPRSITIPAPAPVPAPAPAQTALAVPASVISPADADDSQPANPAPAVGQNPIIAPAQISGLTSRQQAALTFVVVSPSLSQAALAAGVNERTLRRWMDEPLFSEAVARLRAHSADLACQELQTLVLRSVSAITDALDAPDPAIRLRAARFALAYVVKIHQVQSLGSELQEIKDALNANLRSDSGENISP